MSKPKGSMGSCIPSQTSPTIDSPLDVLRRPPVELREELVLYQS